MWTESVECVPAPEVLKAMSDANYRHKVNGRFVAYDQINKVIGRTIPTTDSSKVIKKSRKLF